MDQLQCVLVLTTWPAEGDAALALRALVEERLAACVNVFPPMESLYRWQGVVERAPERQVLIKTTAGRIDDVLRRLKSLHPYDVPELLVVPVAGGGDDYLRWVGESTAERGTAAGHHEND